MAAAGTNQSSQLEQLGPMIKDLDRQFRQLRSRVGKAKKDLELIQANSLVDECIKLLRKWRYVNNYPALRAHPKDGQNLDQFQDLFRPAYDCLMKLIELSVDCTIPLRNLVEKSFLVETQPCQTNKLKESKTVGEMEEALSFKVRSLLPFYSKDMKTEVVIKDFDQSSKSTPKLYEQKLEVESSDSEKFKANRMVFTGRLKGAKPMKKTERRLYYLTMKIEFSGHKIDLETLPIGFYTHTTQIPVLSGHIVWYNAFSKTEDPPVRQEFPSSASLQELLPVLNTEFHHESSVIAKSMKSTKRGDSMQTSSQRFNPNNEHCLAEMLGVANPRDIVTIEGFLKTKVGRESKFTFWEWFYACFKTRCEYLPNLYEKGLVVGFITKEHTEQQLIAKYSTLPPGSKILLLRFSNNYLDDHHGLISPSVIRVRNDPEHGRPIKAGKYRKDEKKLGLVLLSEIGSEEYPNLNLMVFTTAYECVSFATKFEDFMEETDTFVEYRQLSRDSEGSIRSTMPSPASSDASSLSLFATSMDNDRPGCMPSPPTYQFSSDETVQQVGVDMDFEQAIEHAMDTDLMDSEGFKQFLNPIVGIQERDFDDRL